ncbi:MAG: 5'/3'-nucleotidase SurE [Candidatus Izemoplasmatales bacterium]
MKILVTNDDGYQAVGIRLLADLAKKYGDVTVVAPHTHMSGASVSRGGWFQSKAYRQEEGLYSVEGTPADAVHFGIFGLDLKPDLVLSGINDGLNIGIDTIYSGTVGAAMEALKARVPAIAFSCDFGHYGPAEKHFDEVMRYIVDHDLTSRNYVLNVNFPSKRYETSKGVMVTDIAFRPMHHYYVEGPEGVYKNKRSYLPYDFIPGTDLWAAENGYTSITPLKLGNRTSSGLAELKKKVGELE